MQNSWNVGGWRVNLREGWIARRGRFPRRKVRPDARLLAVLKALIENAGRTVTTESLLTSVWPDRVVSRDSVTTAIYQLRQLLGDSAEHPAYIASVPRRGYRLIAPTIAAEERAPLKSVVGVAATLALAGALAWLLWQPADIPAYLYVEPIQNYEESPVQEPLFSAIESTFLSELIQTVPGRVRTDDGDDVALRLQAMMVACDLGPTLVMKLLDTRNDTYIWSQNYNLEETAASTERRPWSSVWHSTSALRFPDGTLVTPLDLCPDTAIRSTWWQIQYGAGSALSCCYN
jgi:DNA-binding winged helix-turn-helix (wHTH) protein